MIWIRIFPHTSRFGLRQINQASNLLCGSHCLKYAQCFAYLTKSIYSTKNQRYGKKITYQNVITKCSAKTNESNRPIPWFTCQLLYSRIFLYCCLTRRTHWAWWTNTTGRTSRAWWTNRTRRTSRAWWTSRTVKASRTLQMCAKKISIVINLAKHFPTRFVV